VSSVPLQFRWISLPSLISLDFVWSVTFSLIECGTGTAPSKLWPRGQCLDLCSCINDFEFVMHYKDLQLRRDFIYFEFDRFGFEAPLKPTLEMHFHWYWKCCFLWQGKYFFCSLVSREPVIGPCFQWDEFIPGLTRHFLDVPSDQFRVSDLRAVFMSRVVLIHPVYAR
jgi:hypothetical protein